MAHQHPEKPPSTSHLSAQRISFHMPLKPRVVHCKLCTQGKFGTHAWNNRKTSNTDTDFVVSCIFLASPSRCYWLVLPCFSWKPHPVVTSEAYLVSSATSSSFSHYVYKAISNHFKEIYKWTMKNTPIPSHYTGLLVILYIFILCHYDSLCSTAQMTKRGCLTSALDESEWPCTPACSAPCERGPRLNRSAREARGAKGRVKLGQMEVEV